MTNAITSGLWLTIGLVTGGWLVVSMYLGCLLRYGMYAEFMQKLKEEIDELSGD